MDQYTTDHKTSFFLSQMCMAASVRSTTLAGRTRAETPKCEDDPQLCDQKWDPVRLSLTMILVAKCKTALFGIQYRGSCCLNRLRRESRRPEMALSSWGIPEIPLETVRDAHAVQCSEERTSSLLDQK